MHGVIAEKETYDGYTPDWYMATGNAICWFVFFSSLITSSIHFLGFLKVVFRRCKDRGYRFRMKKDPDDPDDDAPNSRLKY